MKKRKNILKSRGVFYWSLIIALSLKVLSIYLSTKEMFYLNHIFQGFLLTILMPALLIAMFLGFASFIRNKWLYYGVSLVVVGVGSGLLLLDLLYYRARTHFIFFPNKVATVGKIKVAQGAFLNTFRLEDSLFFLDVALVLIVGLVLLILTSRKQLEPDMTTVLADYQTVLSSMTRSLEQTTEQLRQQKTRLSDLSASNTQLKIAQPKNDELIAEVRQLEMVKSQLDQVRVQKTLDLQALKVNTSDERVKVEKAKAIAQNVYAEMLASLGDRG